MNAVVLQSHLRVNLELKKKKQKTTLDPMNAKIDLATFNYVKKFPHWKKKYFGLLTLLFIAIAIEVSWWQNDQIGEYGNYW